MSLKEYYSSLLILQYRSKPRAKAHVELLADLATINSLPLEVQNAFDVEDAIGAQLDVLGNYAGVERGGYVFGTFVSLDDDDYRSLIKLALIKNNSGSSLAEIQQLLFDFFPSQIFVVDYANMRLGYLIDSDAGSINFVFIAIQNNLLPKPMAVGIGGIIYAPDVTIFFGFEAYAGVNPNNKPLNTYSVYNSSWRFLKYSDLIPFT